MSESVTLDIPDELARQARAVAAQTHRRVEDVLLDWLGRAATDLPIDALSDEEVLALCELQMDESQQAELSQLLSAQREGTVDDDGKTRLDELMGMYRRGMVRKAQAIKVAVERGLRPSIGSV